MTIVDPRPVSVDVEPTVVSLGRTGATDEQVKKAQRPKRRGASPKPKEKEATDGSQS